MNKTKKVFNHFSFCPICKQEYKNPDADRMDILCSDITARSFTGIREYSLDMRELVLCYNCFDKLFLKK